MSRARLVLVLAVLGVAVYTAAAGSRRPGAVGAIGARARRVVRVVDGDTIHVRVGGRDERVRYIGIDTPESVKPGTPVQCFAEARQRVQQARWWPASAVRLVRDAEARDRYGRLLAYVYRARDDLFINADAGAPRLRRAADDPAQRRARGASSARWPQPHAAAGAGCGRLADRHKIICRGDADATEPRRARGRLRRGDRRGPRAPRAPPAAGDPAHAACATASARKKHGSLRFWLVLLTLIATAVIVTVAMFETLYYVMG